MDAKILADEIGLIIVSTMTPESIMPSTACLVQAEIGASNALCFDLNAACSGFVSAFVTARTYLESKLYVMHLSSEARCFQCSGLARQGSCILFGDGAGAVILEASKMIHGFLFFMLMEDSHRHLP